MGFADGAVHAWQLGGRQARGPSVTFHGHVGGVAAMLMLHPRTLVVAAAGDHVLSVWGSDCGGARCVSAVGARGRVAQYACSPTRALLIERRVVST